MSEIPGNWNPPGAEAGSSGPSTPIEIRSSKKPVKGGIKGVKDTLKKATIVFVPGYGFVHGGKLGRLITAVYLGGCCGVCGFLQLAPLLVGK